MRKIWLDDMRPNPEGYLWVKDYDEAVAAWTHGGTPDVASLDHDLWGYTAYVPGVKEYTGYDFTEWLCGDDPYEVDSGRWPHHSLAIHTDRADGRARMADLIERFGPYDKRDVYDWAYPGWTNGYVKVYGYIYTMEPAYVS